MSNKLRKRQTKVDAGVLKRQRRGNQINNLLKKMGYDGASVSVDDNGNISIKADMADGTTKVIGGANPKDLVDQAYKEAEADPKAKEALDNYVNGNLSAKLLLRGMQK